MCLALTHFSLITTWKCCMHPALLLLLKMLTDIDSEIEMNYDFVARSWVGAFCFLLLPGEPRRVPSLDRTTAWRSIEFGDQLDSLRDVQHVAGRQTGEHTPTLRRREMWSRAVNRPWKWVSHESNENKRSNQSEISIHNHSESGKFVMKSDNYWTCALNGYPYYTSLPFLQTQGYQSSDQ